MMKTRDTKMIGRNIRPGFTPGGFTGSVKPKGPRTNKPSMAKIQDAAKEFMQERGLDEPPKQEFLFGAKLPEAK